MTQLKISDFGTAIKLCNPNETVNEAQGTIYYMAPEVHQGCYGIKCDVWSLGIMLFFMLTGRFPFKGDTEEEITNNIKVGQINYALKEWKQL